MQIIRVSCCQHVRSWRICKLMLEKLVLMPLSLLLCICCALYMNFPSFFCCIFVTCYMLLHVCIQCVCSVKTIICQYYAVLVALRPFQCSLFKSAQSYFSNEQMYRNHLLNAKISQARRADFFSYPEMYRAGKDN